MRAPTHAELCKRSASLVDVSRLPSANVATDSRNIESLLLENSIAMSQGRQSAVPLVFVQADSRP